MLVSEISIKRPVLASMMSLALVLFGLVALMRLPVRELPDIDPPIVTSHGFPRRQCPGRGNRSHGEAGRGDQQH